MPREQYASHPWLITAAVMLGTFMEVLDTTVVNVSLRHIAANLSSTVDEATWVLTSYLVANAVILPMTGWLANHFGRKRMLLVSISGFTLSSLACAMAPNLSALLVFRVIQGATGGGLQPLSQAIMLESFPPEKRGRAVAFLGLGIILAPMLGPVIGGWVTESYSWRWLFYINLPVGITAIVLSQIFVFDPPYIKRREGGVDYWGIGLLVVGMGALQVMLDKGQEDDWFSSNFIVTLAIIAVVGLTAFIVREMRASNPVVNLRLFRIRTYASGVLLMTSLGVVLYGSTVLIPIFLQNMLGYTALDAGLTMLPRGFGSFAAMLMVGQVITKVDPRKLLVVGYCLAAFSLWRLSHLNLNAGYWDFFWPQVMLGASFGIIFVVLTTITHDPIPPAQMGNASSIYNLTRNIGGSVGIAAVTTIIARQTQRNINVLGAHVSALDGPSQLMLAKAREFFLFTGSDWVTATRQAYAAVFGMVQQQAAMLSFNKAFLLQAILFLSVIPLILLMKRPTHARGGGVGH